MKELSCGFIIVNKSNPKQILACQPHGRRANCFGNYDIPKGHIEEGETTFEAAVRELREETGDKVTNEKIYDCGLFQYIKNKDLYVYLMFANIDIGSLHCDSTFEYNGRMVAEVVNYKWTEEHRLFYKSLQPIIEECLEHYEEGYYEEVS